MLMVRCACFQCLERWQHPDSGVLIDRHKLQQMLGEAAQLAQQRLGGAARVLSRVMDLTPRLGRLEAPR